VKIGGRSVDGWQKYRATKKYNSNGKKLENKNMLSAKHFELKILDDNGTKKTVTMEALMLDSTKYRGFELIRRCDEEDEGTFIYEKYEGV